MLAFGGTAGNFRLRIALPAILICAGTLATVVYSLNQMAAEANRIEARLTARSANAAVQSYVRRIGESNGDYAQWDDAVRALYGPAIDQEFVEQNIVASTATPTFFDTAYLLDENNNDVFGYRLGEKLAANSAEMFGPSLPAMVQKLPRDGKTYAREAGILKTEWGLAAVAVGPVVPNTDGIEQVPARSRLLVTAKLLDAAAVERLGEDFVIEQLHLEDVAGPASVPIIDPNAQIIGHLGWSARHLGSEANAEVSPTIFIMLALLGLTVAVLLGLGARGVREIRSREQQAQYAATHDALTGLPNRTALIQGLDAAIKAKHAADAACVLVYLDLDGFKDVNDAYGHETGDRLLRQVADRFKALSGDQLLARLGGDEFSLLVTGPEARDVACAFGASAIEQLKHPFDIDGRVIIVGTSLGIAVADKYDLSAEELLRRADVAMYSAKQQGPNRTFIYDAVIDTLRHERIAIANDLRRAIRANELAMVYQPIFDARTREIIAAEALLRWTRPTTGPMPPSAFIAIAEETGLIEELGAWVLRRACRDALAWPDIRLSVNVSPAQFRNPTFNSTITSTLRETGFSANRLELEVTENYFISQPEQAREAISGIRALGVRVALDDFGTGYSSIGYLRRFEFDMLKLDRSMLANIARDQGAQRLVQATIALADALGLRVTAEGVETEEEATLLRAAGCHEFQGFLLAKPCSASEFSKLVKGRALSNVVPIALSA